MTFTIDGSYIGNFAQIISSPGPYIGIGIVVLVLIGIARLSTACNRAEGNEHNGSSAGFGVFLIIMIIGMIVMASIFGQ